MSFKLQVIKGLIIPSNLICSVRRVIWVVMKTVALLDNMMNNGLNIIMAR